MITVPGGEKLAPAVAKSPQHDARPQAEATCEDLQRKTGRVMKRERKMRFGKIKSRS
jgi:hypothetical protein